MIRSITGIFFLLITQQIVSQSETLYLLTENPVLGFSCEKSLSFGFAIKSNNKKFSTNYYKFDIENIKSFSEDPRYNFEYYTKKELRKEIKIDTIKYETISTLTKNKEWWQVHDELSLNRKIFLLEKISVKENGTYKNKYYALPMIYVGTRKNIVPTNLSFYFND